MVCAYINPRSYRSLAEFFTRSLKDDVRFIDPNSSIVSPCDGRVLHFGSATTEQIEQVKTSNFFGDKTCFYRSL